MGSHVSALLQNPNPRSRDTGPHHCESYNNGQASTYLFNYNS